MNALPLILSLFLIFIPAIDREEFKESIDPVILAIDSGSSSELARYFENSISLNINGQQGDFSRNQAEQVIRDFFKKNPPLRFQLVYRS
jgi:hypothetical protein